MLKALVVFRGKIKKGKQRGKPLGFPTANVTLQIKLPEGVYASKVKIEGRIYLASTFIGSAKTFGENDYKAECHILDFKKDIYGKWVTVRLFKKVRKNKKFNSKKSLMTQMKRDISSTRKFFGQNP